MSELSRFVWRRTPGEAREFAINIPRPTPTTFLEFIALYACKLPEFCSGSVHLLAIANSGVPISTAILMRRLEHRAEGCNEDRLTVVDPNRPELIPSDFYDRQIHIIVDNSVKSMRTIFSVVDKLRAAGVSQSSMVKLIDYGDQLEVDQERRLLRECGLRVTSLFLIDDLPGSVMRQDRK